MSRHLHLPAFGQAPKRAPGPEEIEREVQDYLYGEHRHVELVSGDGHSGEADTSRNALPPSPRAAH